jgi:SAM-dependent methyltransferase
VFVPGCGRGYDLVEFLRSGAAQAVGLDFAPGAAEAAQAYLAGELREGEQGRAKVRTSPWNPALSFVIKMPAAFSWQTRATIPISAFGCAALQVFQGDFFKWTHPEVPQWDVGYDYTFFCALHPSMRGDWASAWARLLAPGARLICLAFPLNHGTQTGPPWPVTLDDYKQLLLPAGFELEKEEPVPPERSHPGRASKECMLVFRRV